MATVVNDLVTKFSFLGSVRPLDEFNGSLGGSIKLLGGMFAALNAGSAAFTLWADGVLTGVDAMEALHRQTGVAVSTIQELNFIAGQTQSTSAAVESTIRGLTSTIGTAAQKGSDDFARLGLSVRDANGEVKDADTVLDEVAQRFRALGLSMKEQEHFAGALGIDTSLLQMMNKTGQEMAAMRDRARELGILTAEQTEQAALYKQALNSMWFGLNSVKQLIAVGVAPEMSRMAENFSQLLADNKDWIVNGIQLTVKWVGNLLEAFNRLLPVFALMTAGFIGMKIAALGFATVMGAILSPVVLITAGIVALLAIADDLIVAFRGGKSVIADFFQEFFNVDIVAVLRDVGKELEALFDHTIATFAPLFDFFIGLFGGIGRIFRGDMQGAIDAVMGSFDALAKFINGLFTPIFNALRDAAASLLPQWAIDLLGVGGNTPSEGIAAGAPRMQIPIGSDVPTAPAIDNRRIEQSNQITIHTNDAEAAGRAVGDNLQRQLDNANTQLGKGGR